VADIFISYTSADRDWAFWIGHELKDLGHVAHIHEWELSGGADIMAWMETQHDKADQVLCVVSAAYLEAPYSSWERRAAEWAAATDRPRFALPVHVELCKVPTLLAPFKRCDLYGIDEIEAREKLKAFLEPATKPPRGRFPGGKPASATPSSSASAPAFPGKPRRKPRNLPYVSLEELFKGREDILGRLHEALAESKGGRAIAFHGLGGVGKTRLAVEYAWRHETEHRALLFVSAETPERLDAGLAALAGPEILDLAEKDAHEDAKKIAAVLGWLEANPGWLMILDNVDDETAAGAVEALATRLEGGHALVTGRTGDFSAAIETFSVDVLSEADAASLLLDSTKKRETAANDEPLAYELAHELGGLALALAQAGAYVDKQRTSFARYLKLWRETREAVLRWFDKRLLGTNRDIGLAATWKTSVEKLTPQGLRLLEICAFLDAAPIAKFLLDVPITSPLILSLSKDETGSSSAPQDEGTNPTGPHASRRPYGPPQHEGESLPNGPHAEEAAKPPSRSTRATATITDPHEALADLYAYSLASPAEVSDGKTVTAGFTVHRLVQDFTRRGMTEERRREALQEALGWVNIAFVGHPSDVRSWPVLDPLAPHALALAQHGDKEGIAEPTSRLTNDLGLLLFMKARHAEAEPLMRRALAIDEARYGPDHPAVATRLNNLAQLLYKTNRLTEAEHLMRRVLKMYEASYGPHHSEMATGLNNLAILLYATNRLVEAEPLYRRALSIDEASFGPDDANVARDLNNLSQLLKDTNRLAEAEALTRRALRIDEVSYGPDHPVVARDLNNLGLLLYATKHNSEAEPLFRRALAITEANYGSDHPDAAIQINNLAELLRMTKRYSEAEPLYRRALAILETSYGPVHPQVATCLGNLALLLQATNRRAEVEPLMRRALAIDVASLGPDHPTTRRISANLTTVVLLGTFGRLAVPFRALLARLRLAPRR